MNKRLDTTSNSVREVVNKYGELLKWVSEISINRPVKWVQNMLKSIV